MKRFLTVAALVSLLATTTPARAAIQYGSSTQQAPFAASTTEQIGNLINQAASGDLTNGSSTIDTGGVLNSIGKFFSNVNDWLKENAGIDFFGILKGIGHFFIVVVGFVVNLVKKAL